MEPMELDPANASSSSGNNGEQKNPIMVVMIGPPGSGKSTFCENVMRASTLTWVRVCQDTIGNGGKAGTRAQCIASATSALKEGKSVFIDRCNIDREQRADFLKLGGPQVQKHAVALDLPAKLCISRSVKRTDHEGKLQGGKAAAVVNRVLQKKEIPKLSEGFSRISLCYSEKDVEDEISGYSKLGLGDTLPLGCFGEKKIEAKAQPGIMKFFKKVDPSVKDELVESKEKTLSFPPNKVTAEKESGLGGQGYLAPPSDVHECQKDSAVSPDSVPTLAFPSISTADFQFDLEKASDVIVEKVEEFMDKLPNARLVLVDLSHRSKILSLVQAKAERKNINPGKFLTFVGDITRLYSAGGLRCSAIANAANWRLKPGGGGVNAAIYSAAGPELDTATKERASSLAPGKALVVPLPSTSPLSVKEGITHVIHVLGPNMNQLRPNYLNNDYVKGCKVLREAYSSLFEGFASILAKEGQSSERSSESSINLKHGSDQKVKRDASDKCEANKKSKSLLEEVRLSLGPSVHKKLNLESRDKDGGKTDTSKGSLKDSKDEASLNRTWGSWAQALHQIAMHPEKHTKDIIETLDDVVVISDLYQKARKHLLVLARAEGIDQLADVRIEHLPLLNRMHSVGLKWVEQFQNEDASLVFRLGYHSVPSMRQLHLHVISQDFDSKHFKNKKHWNSFNTPFFRDSVDVMEEVREHGKAVIKGDDTYQSMELRCHRCRSAHPNIPRLKTHIGKCRADFPGFLLENDRLVFRPGSL